MEIASGSLLRMSLLGVNLVFSAQSVYFLALIEFFWVVMGRTGYLW